MRKIICTLFTCCLLYFGTNAQYCGGSSPIVCNPDTTLSHSGFSPSTDSLPPFVNGDTSHTVIQLKNYDTLIVNILGNPTPVVVDTLTVDSIGNLPRGLCWVTNQPNNTFLNKQAGCIKLAGIPCDSAGQYRLKIFVHGTVTVPFLGKQPTGPKDGDSLGLVYYVRLRNQTDAIIPVDTTQLVLFHGYHSATTGCTLVSGISEIEGSFNSLSIVPNPVNSTAKAIFNSLKSGIMTERITNIIGAEVHRAEKEVKAGSNVFTIERNNLPPGVYFYSLSDGTTLVTKRMVIAE